MFERFPKMREEGSISVKELREAAGMSRRAFASEIDCTEQSVFNWEKAEYAIDAKGIHPLFKRQLERFAHRHKIPLKGER